MDISIGVGLPGRWLAALPLGRPAGQFGLHRSKEHTCLASARAINLGGFEPRLDLAAQVVAH